MHNLIRWLVETFIFSPWVNIFILWAGLYRLHDGRARLKYEAKDDHRVDQIPDADVRQLWHTLSKLNIQYGRFFIGYGWYLIAVAVINFYFYGYLNLDFTNLVDHALNRLMFAVLLFGLPISYVIAKSNCFFYQYYYSIVYIIFDAVFDALFFDNSDSGINYTEEKECFYRWYQEQDFEPRKSEYWARRTFPDQIPRLDTAVNSFFSYKMALVGSFIWYPLVILTSFYLICYQWYLMI